MIPMLILYALRKFSASQSLSKKFLIFKKFVKKTIAVLCLLAFASNYASNPPEPIIFNIVKNNVVIGSIKITESKSKDSVTYTVDSEVEAQFILKYKVVGKEKYIYKNGILIYASLFRTLNNKVKTNHSIVYNQGQYSIETPNKISPLNLENIKQNLMTLYITEPIGIESVFCDNQKQMVSMKSLGNGSYKVELSKGKYNIFHYKNGKCIKVVAVSPIFDVILIPVVS